MKNLNLTVENSAKNTEIVLAYFLQKKIYKDVSLIVGDGYGRFPDIRSVDDTLGIEVVQAEFPEDFVSNIIWKKYEKFKGNARKIKTYIKTKLKSFETMLFINKNKVEAWHVKMAGQTTYYSRNIFEKAICKKLEKLNDGNYASINGEVNLALVSVFREKPDKVIKDIQQKYAEVRDLYNQTFKKIFVLFPDSIFEINGEKITKYELSNEELNALEKDFKAIIKNSGR